MNIQQKNQIASLRFKDHGSSFLRLESEEFSDSKKIMTNAYTKKSYFTGERIHKDLDYYRAQKIAKNMLTTGLISQGEFNKLVNINLETFYPLFAEIAPKKLDNNTL